MSKRFQNRRIKPAKPGQAYRQCHRVIDGAIRDAFAMHPDYLTPKGAHMNTARRSIAKRATGAILGWVEQSTQGRSGQDPAAVRRDRAHSSGAHDEGCKTSSLASQPPATGGSLVVREARP